MTAPARQETCPRCGAPMVEDARYAGLVCEEQITTGACYPHEDSTPTPPRDDAGVEQIERGWELINGYVRELRARADEQQAHGHTAAPKDLDAIYGAAQRLREDAAAVSAALVSSAETEAALRAARQRIAAVEKRNARLALEFAAIRQLVEVGSADEVLDAIAQRVFAEEIMAATTPAAPGGATP